MLWSVDVYKFPWPRAKLRHGLLGNVSAVVT